MLCTGAQNRGHLFDFAGTGLGASAPAASTSSRNRYEPFIPFFPHVRPDPKKRLMRSGRRCGPGDGADIGFHSRCIREAGDGDGPRKSGVHDRGEDLIDRRVLVDVEA